MLLSPKIVYICDHSITLLIKDVLNELHLKQSSDIDTIITGDGVMESVYAVYKALPDDLFTYYYENIDFVRSTDNVSIQWTTANRPLPGEYFNIEYTKSLMTITQYEAEDCPRCAGTGWYVGIFEDNGTTTKKISGISSLVQNFMKILLTMKSAEYGSTIIDISGSEIGNQTSLASQIVSIVLDCESSFKQIQLTDIYAGTLLDPSEKLQSATVTSVEFDTAVGAIYLSILLLSEAGPSADINLIL